MVYKPYTNLTNTWNVCGLWTIMWNKNVENFGTYMENGLNGGVSVMKKF